MGKVLANISSRGTLYAILVTHQNQELRSITVNVLHGIPAEHRNMPVDDAIAFIGTNFQENRQKLSVNLPKSIPIQPVGNAPPLNERHPEAVQALLNLLAENRPLTVFQYERIIKYLQERKVLQIKAELGDTGTDDLPTPEELAEVARAEAKVQAEKELQDKIMHILNKPSIIPTIVPEDEPPVRPVQVATSSSSSNSNSNLLHDPKVQKALDSLLGGFQF